MSGSFTACKTCFFATRDDREERFSCITCLANSRSLKTLIKEIHQQQENIDFTKAQISRSRPSPTDPHPPASILQDIAQLKAKLFLTSNTIHNLNCSIISRSTTPPISKTWTSIPIPTQTLTTLATTQSQLSSIQTFHTTQQKLSTQKGERAKQASLDEDEHTRDELREMATDIKAASTAKLTLLQSSLHFARRSLPHLLPGHSAVHPKPYFA